MDRLRTNHFLADMAANRPVCGACLEVHLLRCYDFESGTSVTQDFGVRYVPGERVFVPKSARFEWLLAE